MREPCTVQTWWACPTNIALMVLMGLGFWFGMISASDRSASIAAGQVGR